MKEKSNNSNKYTQEYIVSIAIFLLELIGCCETEIDDDTNW